MAIRLTKNERFYVDRGSAIQAIKELRERKGIGLKEAAEAVWRYRKNQDRKDHKEERRWDHLR